MTTLVLLSACLAHPVVAAPAPPQPGRVVVLGETSWYRGPAVPETTFVGQLVARSTPAGVTYSVEAPLSPIALQVLTLETRDRGRVLRPFLGRKVSVTVKTLLVKDDVTRPPPQHLVGWVEVVGDAGPGPRAVLARTPWQPPVPLGRGVQVVVFRSGEGLAPALRVAGPGAPQAATAALAKRLGVPALDWERHMLVAVTAGLGTGQELAVVGAAVRDGRLVVRYRLGAGPPGVGPVGETVLLPRFDGPVVTVRDTP